MTNVYVCLRKINDDDFEINVRVDCDFEKDISVNLQVV